MRVSYGELKELIRQKLIEGSERPGEVTLVDGSSASHGSDAHISDMQAVLNGLEALKKQHRYGTAARAKFADAGNQLKRIIGRVSRSGQAQEQPPKTFAQLEDDHGGMGRGSGGQGQYSPGFDRRK